MTAATITVTQSTKAAVLILEHAERVDLPLPFDVSAVGYKPDVRLMFRTLADLTDWAMWLDEPIAEEPVKATIHYTVAGLALDHPIICTYVDTEPNR